MFVSASSYSCVSFILLIVAHKLLSVGIEGLRQGRPDQVSLKLGGAVNDSSVRERNGMS